MVVFGECLDVAPFWVRGVIVSVKLPVYMPLFPVVRVFA